ncbi:MAG: hypothetical protein Q7S33_05095, partial [Nanoarchaeota archaeon]|nr:hypothetical protein [Nanoarchaeota archaeon]
MVYKKYIKRDGKIFGPYLYKSKKENGKVITEYLGKENQSGQKKKTKFNAFYSFIVIIFLILILSFTFFINSPLTGKTIFDFSSSSNLNLETPASYNLGDLVYGNVSLGLKNGELIPADSVVRFSLNKQTKDVLISDLISAQSANGDFYSEGFVLTGSGLGYGIEGTKESYPDVDFVLKIVSGEIQTEETTTPAETIEPVQNETTETPVETPTTETLEETTTETTETTTTPESVVETPITDTDQTSLITGNVIASGANEISGKVSKDQPFEYNLNNGETAEVVSSSQPVIIEIKGNKIYVTTNYAVEEKGFGQDYLGNDLTEFNFDLSGLGFIAEQGDLKVALVYNENEITSTNTKINIAKETETETETNTTEIPEEEILEETNETLEELNQTETLNETLNITEILNETLSNITELGNLTINTIQYGAELNKPVKWVKNIKIDEQQENVSVEIPIDAENISVYKISEEQNQGSATPIQNKKIKEELEI